MNNQSFSVVSTKVCSKCKEEKPLSEFPARKDSKDGHRNECKICKKQLDKQNHLKHRKEHNLKRKKYHINHKRKENLKSKQYRSKHKNERKQYDLKNKDKISLQKKQWCFKNRNGINQRRNKRRKQRIKTDNNFRIYDALRSRMKHALKSQDVKKTLHTIESLGCTAEFFQIYIQSLLKPGMTLANNGKRKWHLHHIKSCHTFNMSDPKQQRLCFHYTNIVPMWEDEHKEWHRNHSQ